MKHLPNPEPVGLRIIELPYPNPAGVYAGVSAKDAYARVRDLLAQRDEARALFRAAVGMLEKFGPEPAKHIELLHFWLIWLEWSKAYPEPEDVETGQLPLTEEQLEIGYRGAEG